jgi:hypothetical protein
MIKQKIIILLFMSLLFLVGNCIVNPVYASKSDDTAGVIIVTGILTFTVSALSSLSNAKYLDRGTPNKTSGIVGVAAGLPTVLAGVLIVGSELGEDNDPGVVTGAFISTVGAISIYLGMRNIRGTSTSASGDDFGGVRFYPTVDQTNYGRTVYGIGIAFSY